jgi:hypothetical protein
MVLEINDDDLKRGEREGGEGVGFLQVESNGDGIRK